MQNDDKQKTLFGYPVVEVEMKDIPENPQIVLGDMSAYVTWRIQKRHLTKRAADGFLRLYSWLRGAIRRR